MGDKTGEIHQDVCRSRIQWVAGKRLCMKEVPGMVQRHDDHDKTAQDINRIDPVLSHRLKKVGFRHVVKLIFFCLFGMPLSCIGKSLDFFSQGRIASAPD